jgi:hypothetical protein
VAQLEAVAAWAAQLRMDAWENSDVTHVTRLLFSVRPPPLSRKLPTLGRLPDRTTEKCSRVT